MTSRGKGRVVKKESDGAIGWSLGIVSLLVLVIIVYNIGKQVGRSGALAEMATFQYVMPVSPEPERCVDHSIVSLQVEGRVGK